MTASTIGVHGTEQREAGGGARGVGRSLVRAGCALARSTNTKVARRPASFGPPAGSKEAGRLATFVLVDRANAHPARTSDRPTPRAPPPASLCSVPCTPIVEAVMSRRKRKNRTATPTVPTALTAPADH